MNERAGEANAETGVTIERAGPGDVAEIAARLTAAGLPHEDFARHLGSFLVARPRTERGVVGVIGAEVYGEDALLRSLVVAPNWRRRGVGDALLRELELQAEEWGVRRWWLLTTTAVKFFAQRGFRVTPRIEAPHGVAATEEFRELCPSEAVCMSRPRRSG
jgi:N-acetylglutamate synthase and related acetyltransferases